MSTPPSEHTRSRQSSISSNDSGASAGSAGQQAPPPFHASLAEQQLDPLSRAYPKPAQEIDVREALARKPMKWTLGHYFKETPTREPHAQTVDRATRALDLEAKKRELLKAKDEIRMLALPKQVLHGPR
ncbi:hypothetical protein M406DRAFT_325476 [Cryphonectria parasitica EP155]|uniref:Uncharacterized protein n=1 Tax=Cryphonectria parasitica (strain ATCC 38755 / EP155) TaxID=660469 RepID=A0A9P5CUD4_CRYP1|nr:uncharacterized protein M406DRAFT_325476 [Cryphonectria parasitica EP155]KAF3770000.1 hypothetical protein M406DRAFT_325476 [Cryphonectria parasitica EP155]